MTRPEAAAALVALALALAAPARGEEPREATSVSVPDAAPAASATATEPSSPAAPVTSREEAPIDRERWAIDASAYPSAGGAPSDSALVTSAYRGADLGFGVQGGPDLAGIWVEALAELGRLSLGFRGGGFGHRGIGGMELVLSAGPRFPLSARTRLDVLGDLGFALASLDSSSSEEDTTLAVAGARVGFTFQYRPDRFFRLGALVRHTPTQTVSYTDTACLLSACWELGRKEKTVGGTTLGAYLSWGATFPANQGR